MDPIYEELIKRELAKIEALRKRIDRHEDRIRVIREMAVEDLQDAGGQGTPQALLSVPGPVHVAPKEGEGEEFRFPSRISAANLRLLSFIGHAPEGRSLDELVTYAEMTGAELDRAGIVSFANVYRTRFGLVESPSMGHYRLTARGQEFLRMRGADAASAQEDNAESNDLA